MSKSNLDRSILIVDDDDVFRDRLSRAFQDRGFDVRNARNTDEAIDVARADSPEIAIVDLRMPGRSGLDLVKELAALDSTTKILVLTGYGSIATAVEAMKLGATGYLPKPADVDEILDNLNETSRPPDTVFSAPSLARAEWEHIQRVLSDCDGNISETSRRLKIHRRSLQRKLQKFAPER